MGLARLVFGVAVVAAVQPRLDGRHTGPGLPPLALQVQAVGLHADAHLVLGHRAVLAAVGVDREPEPVARAEMAQADRPTLRCGRRIAQAMRRAERPRARTVQQPGHAHIAVAAVKGIQMQRPIALPGLQQGRGTAFGIARRGLQARLTLHTLHTLAWNAVVDDIDHAADGAAAVQQGRRAAQHLDAVHRQHLDRHRMVRAQGRSVGGGATVVEDAYPVAIEPPDDGTAGVGTKVAAADAGQAAERLAQAAGAALLQGLAAHDADGAEPLLTPQGVAGDDDFVGLGRLGQRRYGEQAASHQPQAAERKKGRHENLAGQRQTAARSAGRGGASQECETVVLPPGLIQSSVVTEPEKSGVAQ